jgi:hypothetical protein
MWTEKYVLKGASDFWGTETCTAKACYVGGEAGSEKAVSVRMVSAHLASCGGVFNKWNWVAIEAHGYTMLGIALRNCGLGNTENALQREGPEGVSLRQKTETTTLCLGRRRTCSLI